jgi:hypothetical protein
VRAAHGRTGVDPKSEGAADETPMSIVLTNRIIAAVLASGASQLEAFAALGAVRELLPSLAVSLVPNAESSSLGSER